MNAMLMNRWWLLVALLLALSPSAQAEAEYFKHGVYYPVRYWDILMQNPAGVQCATENTACTEASGCCSKTCEQNYFGNQVCCQPRGARCRFSTDCCSTTCLGNNTCGDTQVRVEDPPGLVALRNVRTGQRVQCVRTTDDMRVPLTPTYCEVMNWYHAESISYPQARIYFTRPNGQRGALTVSPNHLMIKLTSAAPGTTATSYDAFGSFDTVSAGQLRAGDRIAVLTNLNNATQGFTVVAINAMRAEEAEGMYIPGIDYPYLIADGVVTPIWNINRDPLANIPSGEDGVDVAYKHFKRPTIFMVRMQEIGTEGVNGQWNGDPRWPGNQVLNKAEKPHLDAGEVYDYIALREWFKRRYGEWRANASAGVTLTEMAELVSSDAIWTTSGARLALTDDDRDTGDN